ncbi:hypothetical protein CR205_06730 [Alteribacter lacisalsi]|uniref:GNAT family N-acetyltransferase n=1 Tax=Alteribacter lacisalsi TaxID=2045244 RepID=A0A2W0HAU4_9BACI|nr:hypothetical protein [Alteribacter lacisalsi]PYZ98287.1 hypothetical protein CR205_06730 [Alteribacter lacisalsi]
MLLLQNEESKTKDQLIQEKSDLEFQMFRMQENMKEISKHWNILGIDQTKDDTWVVVYTAENDHTCKVMLHECSGPFKGQWDFAIQATYENPSVIQIDDIKGVENRGFGSVCMDFLKKLAWEKNIQYITGNLVKRDWDHIDRLTHFYKKHNFHVDVKTDQQSGSIVWNPS